jgi:serine/threonine protein kinase
VDVSFTAPEQLGKWQRLSLLGNGAFGDAWIFENSNSKGEYAVVKFLLRSGPSLEVTRTRFIREREILSKLRILSLLHFLKRWGKLLARRYKTCESEWR